MKHWKYYLILFLLTSRCSSALSEKERLKLLEQQVLTQHDEVMSQMDKLNQRQKKLQTYLQKTDTSQIETKLIRKQITDLSGADAAMMGWMHQYQSPADSLSPEKARVYLQFQLVKIKQVKKQVENALANAEKMEQHYETTTKR